MPQVAACAAPELLAPAGDRACAEAAIANGADAIYFGLETGHNARFRATNFAMEALPDLMAELHRSGVRGYVTLNTLAFTDELPPLERHVRQLAAAGVDAVLVQDLGLARLIRAICPELPLHASTQMTMTSAETIAGIAPLGIERVVLGRELSLKEIRAIAKATPMPLEVFVHGALCVAYSGQCLTSESLGGRSANRGQCAQACRLDYQLVCDGHDVDLGDVKYLLSPQDLAAAELVPDLIAAGVASLKIEGRLKSPEYVAATTAVYRRAIDAAMAGAEVRVSAAERRALELTFSRGFAPGWLAGNDHKRLVPGLSSAKRGLRVGTVVVRRGERLVADLQEPLAKGDGIVLAGDRTAGEEIGSRVYQVFQNGAPQETPAAGRVELLLAPGTLANVTIRAGREIWQTDDPRLAKQLRAAGNESRQQRRTALDLHIEVGTGQPVRIWANSDGGATVTLQSEYIVVPAERRPTTVDLLREQFSRLGGTHYELRKLTAAITAAPMVPLSEFGKLRKRLIAMLDVSRSAPPAYTLVGGNVAATMLAAARGAATDMQVGGSDAEPVLHVLCRSLRQVRDALDAGASALYAALHDPRDYAPAVAAARAAGVPVGLASLRIHKPGEHGLFAALSKANADLWLVRNLAALDEARRRDVPCIADFSLNAANPLTVEWLLTRGATRVTASYDLNRDQLLDMVAASRPAALEIVIHQHMPMFHMEHCVFCAVLSPGRNKTDCGRPCDRHEVKLRDRVGAEHVLHADIACRNTVYNATAQSGAEVASPLLAAGVRHFRVELLPDSSTHETRKTVDLYRKLLQGVVSATEVWRKLRAHSRVGVTRGTLETPKNPLAIL